MKFFRILLRLALLAFAAALVLGVLLIGLVAALLAMVWSLLTGRKPAAYTTFMRFREASRQFQSGSWPGRAAPSAGPGAHAAQDSDIVDVQAHEVRSAIEGKN